MKKLINRNGNKSFLLWFVVLLIGMILLNVSSFSVKVPKLLVYSEFYRMLSENNQTQQIKNVTKMGNTLRGIFKDNSAFIVDIPEIDQDLLRALRENVPYFDIKPEKTFWTNFFLTILGPILFFALFWFLIYRSAQGGGGKLLSFGKSRATQISEDKVKVTFNDVAGVDEAKEELKEIIEFLKDPKKFTRLGGKIPKGVLLMGPPGTGKTLLAKAVSGEAGVPFFHISGSDFVEMFVGVGASRVRDLFEQGKRAAKAGGKGCIIFIDEIDAVGRQRFAGIGGGHDEREQTLNALLVEMDGFNTQEGVILIAATNRPDVLDPALVRPGRFDRQIVISRPDIVGREEILKVHVKNIKLDKDINLKSIAKQTPGFSGADLANLANEAALLAARRNKDMVTVDEFQAAIERVIAGPEKKSRVITKEEKLLISYHESGHTLLALLIPEADPPHKVSILPRGVALGYTLTPPLYDRYIHTKKKLMAEIIVALGGRASEEIIFNELSTGAQSDLRVVTDNARMMVTRFGMSEKLGNLTFGKSYEQVFLGRDLGEERNYSEETARLIDLEIRKIVDECYAKATEELIKHKDRLKILAETLFEKEVLDGEEVKKITGLGVSSEALSRSPDEANQQPV
ncbi:MAG: ATP-dependent zinc metalloprotease FtsH [Candidatus Omnitrophota bacterium]